jgi:hypothetical protein
MNLHARANLHLLVSIFNITFPEGVNHVEVAATIRIEKLPKDDCRRASVGQIAY